MQEPKKLAGELQFIKDTPSDEDAFGSLSRIAVAIKAVIDTHPDLRVVGLLGPWGSGKSTLVSLIRKALARDTKTTTRFFVYDAWLHQSDPPRRAFLEELTGFYNLASLPEWRKKIHALSGQLQETETETTPILTAWGKAFLLSLAVVPFGFKFLDPAWLAKTVCSIPVFWIGFTLLLIPSAIVLLAYRFNDDEADRSSIAALFFSREITRRRTTVTHSPDPTAIEFQEMLKEILQHVARPDTRDVFVIDNLDRLSETVAVELWGTIRSFFLGRAATSVNLPIILLPIDPHAIHRMYSSHGEDGPLLAQAFLDKTFDISFSVPPPVFSDWRQYLADKLKLAFASDCSDGLIYTVGLMYEKRHAEAPTPRRLNNIVNSMAVLWLQWKDERIPLETIAFNVLWKAEIEEKGIGKFVREQNPDIAQFDPNWVAGTAAIFFGVPLRRAIQVFLERDLVKSISDGSVKAFLEHADIPGFDKVFLDIMERNTDASFYSKAIYLLGELKPATAPWTRRAWLVLAQRFATAAPRAAASPEAASAIKYLFSNLPAGFLKSQIGALVVSATRLGSAAIPLSGSEWWAELVISIVDAAMTVKCPLPGIQFPGDANNYFSMCAHLQRRLDVVAHIIPPHNASDILAGELGRRLPPSPEWLSSFRALLQVQNTSWNTLVAVVIQIVRTRSGAGADCAAALDILASLITAGAPEAKPEVLKLNAEGILLQKLGEAKNDPQRAKLLALLTLAHPNISLKTTQVNGGGLSYLNRLGEPQLSASVALPFEAGISALIPEQYVNILIDVAEGCAQFRPLTRAVLERKFANQDMRGMSHVDAKARLTLYQKYIPENYQTDFREWLRDPDVQPSSIAQ